MTKKQLVAHKLAVYKAQHEQQAAIDQFSRAMETANVGFIAARGRPTIAMKMAWEAYWETCTRMEELSKVEIK